MPTETEARQRRVADNDTWCRSSSGAPYSFDAYLSLVASFHGHAAPGMIVGGKMTDIALRRIPDGVLFDAICETANCLPDAVQLLTPCTIGNGWLKIIRLGRFALNFYDKYKGNGVRVYLKPDALTAWPEIEDWFFERKPKSEQDPDALKNQIREAGHRIYGVQMIDIRRRFLAKARLGVKTVCPLCGESYPVSHGSLCRGCQGDAPYSLSENAPATPPHPAPAPRLKVLPADFSEGHRALHDMTRIIPGESKGPAFRKGQVIQAGDVCRLQKMGRSRVYVDDGQGVGGDWVHEDDAATAFARKMAGDGVGFDLPPREGKINLTAEREGMLIVDERRLERFNMIPGVMCACRKNHSLAATSRNIAGTRAIPLYLPVSDFDAALSVLDEGPLFRIRPLRQANIGVMVTGTEIFQGLIKDRFDPVIRAKAADLGCSVLKSLIVPDDREAIRRGIHDLLDSGADLLILTAGLSVDPDDVTRNGVIDAGAEDLLYGAPILPGAMTLLARIGDVRLMGVPACALYFKATSLDLLLPRILAGLDITRHDLAGMGNGAFCLECKVCTFPKCPFGK